jgi:hypothetical protein
MRISEIMRPHPNALKRVGIRFDSRKEAITAACKLWHEHGIDAHIQDNDVWIDTVRPMSLPVQGMLERATGVPGFSEWDDDYGTVTR